MNYQKFQTNTQRALGSIYSEGHGGFHAEIIPAVADQMLPHFGIKHNDVILDIGCGTGLFMIHARAQGYRSVIGVTMSPEDQVSAQQQGLDVRLCDMSDLDQPDNTVDFIWCRHALEHSVYPLFTLFEFNRVLKTGGQVFVEVPAPDNARDWMMEYNPNHYSILGDRMWRALFMKAGFEVCAHWVYTITVPQLDKPENSKFVGCDEVSLMYGIRKV